MSLKEIRFFSHLRQLSADIIFLQETHILNSDVIKLRQSWGGQVFHSSFNAKGRGTAILIRKGISFTSEKVISDSSGRFVIVTGRLLDKQVIFVNIYAPNFDDSNFFTKVFTSIPPADDYSLIIGGDFNCVLNTLLDRSSSKVIQPSKAATNIKNLCDQFGLVDPWRFLSLLPGHFPFSRLFITHIAALIFSWLIRVSCLLSHLEVSIIALLYLIMPPPLFTNSEFLL